MTQYTVGKVPRFIRAICVYNGRVQARGRHIHSGRLAFSSYIDFRAGGISGYVYASGV